MKTINIQDIFPGKYINHLFLGSYYDDDSYEHFYMVSNHSNYDIIEAITKFENDSGLDIKYFCYNFNSLDFIYYNKLVEMKIITNENFDIDSHYKDGELVDLTTDDFIDIIELCIKYTIPDFSWERLCLNETLVNVYKQIGVGFFV